MTATEILQQLEALGSEKIKKVLMRHGAREPFFGVKVGDMKTIVKRVKKNHELSLALYDTGNSDAMYLAGLIADEKRITPDDLRHWVEGAYWFMLAEYTVPWVAAESPFGWQLSQEWIESGQEMIATAGWSALASLVIIRPDDQLDTLRLAELLQRVCSTIHQQPNGVRNAMNNFLMATGISVSPLSDLALEIAKKVGKVEVVRGTENCKTHVAADYIQKALDAGRKGYKKKVARC